MTEPCEFSCCTAEADWDMVIYGMVTYGTEPSRSRGEPSPVIRKNVCLAHVEELLRQHPNNLIPWPLWAPSASVPFQYIRCDSALVLLETEPDQGDCEPWFAPGVGRAPF